MPAFLRIYLAVAVLLAAHSCWNPDPASPPVPQRFQNIAVKVLTPQGDPYLSTRATASYGPGADTDDQGVARFVLDGGRSYVIVAGTYGVPCGAAEHTVPPGEGPLPDTMITIQTAPPGYVTGVVIPQGVPHLANSLVHVDEWIVFEEPTDAAGGYVISVPPGTWSVVGARANFEAASLKVTVPAPGDTVHADTLRLKPLPVPHA